jgi:hypothetical protein
MITKICPYPIFKILDINFKQKFEPAPKRIMMARRDGKWYLKW